jgi:hypothetical protein
MAILNEAKSFSWGAPAAGVVQSLVSMFDPPKTYRLGSEAKDKT